MRFDPELPIHPHTHTAERTTVGRKLTSSGAGFDPEVPTLCTVGWCLSSSISQSHHESIGLYTSLIGPENKLGNWVGLAGYCALPGFRN